MGGLIARYYLMYGGADVLDETAAQVTWAGAANVNKLILVGVPNEGTMEALRALVEGYPVADSGLLPLFQYFLERAAHRCPSVEVNLVDSGS